MFRLIIFKVVKNIKSRLKNDWTKGKRVKLQGQFVFSTQEVLKIVREAEEKPKEKKPRGRPRKRPIEELEEEIEEEEVTGMASWITWKWQESFREVGLD